MNETEVLYMLKKKKELEIRSNASSHSDSRPQINSGCHTAQQHSPTLAETLGAVDIRGERVSPVETHYSYRV